MTRMRERLGWWLMGVALPREGEPLRKWNLRLYMLGSRIHNG